MNPEVYGQFLVSSIPGAKYASGKSEILCRCFECPDSADPKSAHFYISIPKNENTVSQYYCQKCHCFGYVTHKKLLQWGIYNDAIAFDLIEHNNKALKGKKYVKFDKRNVFYLNNDYITEDTLSASKLRYFNNRLGLNLTYKDLMEKKIVLNLNDLIKRNNLSLSRNINIVNDLDQSFLGFISIDNAFCNMRRLVEPGKVYKTVDLRYVNYALFNKMDNTERFYTIPKNIMLSQNRRIQLHIAEGPFDILSIYYNLRNQSDDIYTCISGSNYKGILRHFITSMKLPYLEIHLYPDNDKYGSNYVMQDVANYISIFGFPVYIHRNVMKGQKDFGVSLDKIDERIGKIL